MERRLSDPFDFGPAAASRLPSARPRPGQVFRLAPEGRGGHRLPPPIAFEPTIDSSAAAAAAILANRSDLSEIDFVI